MIPETIFKLPFALQLALGGGYLGYLVAYAGIRKHHTTTDVVFRSLAFGLIVTGVLAWNPLPPIANAFVALGAVIVSGALWRAFGRNLARDTLRKTDVSWADDLPTAWLSIVADKTDCPISQIAVDMADGRTVLCEDTRRFEDQPHGPCVFGLDGDVGLYVTDERRPDGTWFKHEDVIHPTEGARMTYVPQSAIRRVELRFWSKKLNAMALPEPGLESVSAAGREE